MQSEIGQQLSSCVIYNPRIDVEGSFGAAEVAYETLNREYPGDEALGCTRILTEYLPEKALPVVLKCASNGSFLPIQRLEHGRANMIDPASGLMTRVMMHTLFSSYPNLWEKLGKFYNSDFYTQGLNSKAGRTACPYDLIDQQQLSLYPQTPETLNYHIIRSLLLKVPATQEIENARLSNAFTIGLMPLRQEICEDIKARHPNLQPGDPRWNSLINEEWPKRIGNHVTPEMQQFMTERQIFAVNISDQSDVPDRLARAYNNPKGYLKLQAIIESRDPEQLNAIETEMDVYKRDLLSRVYSFTSIHGNTPKNVERGVTSYINSLKTGTTFVAAPLKKLLQ